MPTYRVVVGGNTISVAADSPEQAAIQGRLKLAGTMGVQQAEAGAMARSRDAGLDDPMSPEFLALRERGQQEGTAAAAVPSLAILGMGATGGTSLGGAALGVAKDAALGWGLGQAGEMVGLPSWASEALGAAGGLRGLYKAGVKGALGKILAREGAEAAAPKAAGAVVKAEAPEVAAAAARRAELDLAEREAKVAVQKARADAIAAREARAAEKHAADLERIKAQAERLRARATGQIPPKSPKPTTQQPTLEPPVPSRTATAVEPEMLPDDAVAAVVDPIPEPTILPKGQRAMATNLGGKAAPGPAPTPEVDLEDVLRRSIEAAKAKKAAAAASSPLRGPRLERGAERVGKEVGLTKGEVRVATGPRLNEKIGEASPVLPDQPFDKIYDKMIGMKPEERVAYVARARGVKTASQVETIRRTLARAGLLVPVLPSLGEFLAND